jgi:SAM-dependent methyltransferase
METVAGTLSASKDYFAAGRVNWLGRRLSKFGHPPARILDFGCGTGSATPFLLQLTGAREIVGVDISAKSIEIARQKFGSERAKFETLEASQPAGNFDLAFCNGVFHHILPDQRAKALEYVYRSLRPGGLFSFWENNPLNPGTRYIMSRVSFDRDAITLTSWESRRRLRDAGFEVPRADFLFIFPRAMSWLRWIEPGLCRLPLGGQYQVLARKPDGK